MHLVIFLSGKHLGVRRSTYLGVFLVPMSRKCVIQDTKSPQEDSS